jgi:hypothetical protein
VYPSRSCYRLQLPGETGGESGQPRTLPNVSAPLAGWGLCAGGPGCPTRSDRYLESTATSSYIKILLWHTISYILLIEITLKWIPSGIFKKILYSALFDNHAWNNVA